MDLRNLVWYFIGWNLEWNFELHEDFLNYNLDPFEMQGFKSGPYFGLAYFGCFVGVAQMVGQGHPNHQYYLGLNDQCGECDLVDLYSMRLS